MFVFVFVLRLNLAVWIIRELCEKDEEKKVVGRWSEDCLYFWSPLHNCEGSSAAVVHRLQHSSSPSIFV